MNKVMTLKDQVYEYIADEIRQGSLLPDQKINENTICEQLNISRTPVREALIQLAAEGVLENKARRGFVLKPMSQGGAKELYELIGTLDGLAAKKACGKLSEDDYADMDFYIQTMELAVQSRNYQMYYKQQIQFHQTYVLKCGSQSLIDCILQYKKKLLAKTYMDDRQGKVHQLLIDTNQEHRHILELFRQKKAEELFRYLAEVHWNPEYAAYDISVSQ